MKICGLRWWDLPSNARQGLTDLASSNWALPCIQFVTYRSGRKQKQPVASPLPCVPHTGWHRPDADPRSWEGKLQLPLGRSIACSCTLRRGEAKKLKLPQKPGGNRNSLLTASGGGQEANEKLSPGSSQGPPGCSQLEGSQGILSTLRSLSGKSCPNGLFGHVQGYQGTMI